MAFKFEGSLILSTDIWKKTTTHPLGKLDLIISVFGSLF